MSKVKEAEELALISSITPELNEYRVNVKAITMTLNVMKLHLNTRAGLTLLYKMAETKHKKIYTVHLLNNPHMTGLILALNSHITIRV